MKTIEQIMLEFREKCVTYNIGGGFLYHIEDEDCQDFDMDLMSEWLARQFLSLQKDYEAKVVEKKSRLMVKVGALIETIRKEQHWDNDRDGENSRMLDDLLERLRELPLTDLQTELKEKK
jgi:hypothetical protein